jgi:hypothetical protein
MVGNGRQLPPETKTGPEISPGPANQAQRTTNAPNGVPS